MGRYVSAPSWVQRVPKLLSNSAGFNSPALAPGVPVTVVSINGTGKLKSLRSGGGSSTISINCQTELLIDGIVVATGLSGTYAPGGGAVSTLVGTTAAWDEVAFLRTVEVRVTAPSEVPEGGLNFTASYELY